MGKFFQLIEIYKFNFFDFLKIFLISILKIIFIFFPFFIIQYSNNLVFVFSIFIFLYFLSEIIEVYMKKTLKIKAFKFEQNRKIELIDAIKNIELEDLENSDFKNYIFSAKLFIQNYKKTLNFLYDSIVSVFVISLLLLFITYIRWYLSIIYLFIIFSFVYFKLLNLKNTNNIWEKYIENSREHNLINKILLEKEYAYERKIFGVFKCLNKLFLEKFDLAIVENKKDGKNRLKYDIIFELANLVLYFIFIVLLLCLYFNELIGLGGLYILFFSIPIIYTILGDELNKLSTYSNELKNYEYFLKLLEKEKRSFLYNSIQNFDIEFKNVYFRYNTNEKYIIENFSFLFEYGKNYSILGKNGSGKSTLIKLLLGLYKVESGSITVGGINIDDIDSKLKSDIFSVLFQKPKVYPFTVFDNITLGNEKLKKYENSILNDEITKEYISELKDGFYSSVSKYDKNYVDFSGGQWQKIFFSRIFLRNTPIFIFDEPTSNLDAISESSYYKDIEKLLKNRLNIFISHRLGINKYIDKILVIKDGKLIESGTHEELIDNRGEYFEMSFSQKETFETEK